MFQREPLIRGYLPDTVYCNQARVTEFLRRYPSVFIKPDGGGRGAGVVKVWRKGPLIYYVKEKGKPQAVKSVHALFQRLKFQERPHIVQQAIDLARIGGRPFDIRLMMMRDRLKQWKYIGMVAKVAGAQSVITNIAKGKGYVLPIDQALQQSLGLDGTNAAKKKNEMIRLAAACNRAHSTRRYDWQIGYDLGIDDKSKIWFIEINPTVPAHSLFRSQPAVYRRIKQLAAFHRGKG